MGLFGDSVCCLLLVPAGSCWMYRMDVCRALASPSMVSDWQQARAVFPDGKSQDRASRSLAKSVSMPPAPPDSSLCLKSLSSCPRCRRDMKPFEADGHGGNRITLDICEPCHQVWFDERESIGLGSAGWARVLEHPLDVPTPLSAPDSKQAYTCPRCEEPLALLHNVSRYGRYRLHACGHCGGHLQHQSWLLAQHGFCRPLRGPDRLALVREGRRLGCLTCGAPIGPRRTPAPTAKRLRWCSTHSVWPRRCCAGPRRPRRPWCQRPPSGAARAAAAPSTPP